jgi:hypothetical protein
VNLMCNSRTFVLALSLFTFSSVAFAQDPGATLPYPNPGQPNPQADPYAQGAYIPGYSAQGYTCPQPSVIVGLPSAPNSVAQPNAATPQPSAAPAAPPSDANASSPVPVYTSQDSVPSQALSPNSGAAKPYAILTCGTFVRLEFVSPVSSKTARLGDPIALRVAEDIRVGDVVIVPKGTLADGTITFVRRTGGGGMPGVLFYELNALHVNGTSVPLWRHDQRAGDPKIPGAEVLIPVAGVFTLFRHGKDAEFKPGMPLTARVAADTTLPLSAQ